jgi:hypothetical protein
MRTTDHNRINMVTATSGVIQKYKNTWKDHEAFAEGVETLGEITVATDEQIEIAQGNPGAKKMKETVRKNLGTSACEVIGAVGSYATKIYDPELLAKVGYSESNVTAGKTSDVVARCKAIWGAAMEVVDDLPKFGITPAKLALFKKRIDAFDAVKVAPRQNRVKKSAASQLVRGLVRDSVSILRDQLDGLMIQFKDADPNFYEEYFAARVVVDNRGGRVDESVVIPPQADPIPKAA